MRKTLARGAAGLLLAATLAGCGTAMTVPVTGRTQRILVSDEQVLSLSNEEYAKYMKTAKKSADAASTAMVKRVGDRLAAAVEAYLEAAGMGGDIKNYAWEFNLVQDKAVNAFCMPGGKIVVYEGLLPVTQDEASLAIVLGHEIAHAVARHSAEQMSKQLQGQYGTQILGGVLDAVGVGSTTTQIAQAVASKGLEFRSLKYSRDHETEADRMGLVFAAIAGYDPNAAVPFWQRMAAQGGGSGASDIFSDHPSDAKRIAAIQANMPEAMEYYNAVKGQADAAKKTSKQATKKNTGEVSVSSLMKKYNKR